jgi:Zn-dependent peptidase ImmA (M78 family)
MRRGFKAEAERTAQSIRRDMGLRTTDKLVAAELAAHIGAEVRNAEELTSRAKLEQLEAAQPGAFSACTYKINERHVIVYSPLTSIGRRQSDVAHEAGHIILGHAVKEVQHIGALSFFTCDPDEEQEANWLAGCLLLPRQLLVAFARRGRGAAEIAEANEVSEQMAAYRLRTTGVARQFSLSV